jgi:hypothetical protein
MKHSFETECEFANNSTRMPWSDSANKISFIDCLIVSIQAEYLLGSIEGIIKLLNYLNLISAELSHRLLSDRKLVLLMKHAAYGR